MRIKKKTESRNEICFCTMFCRFYGLSFVYTSEMRILLWRCLKYEVINILDAHVNHQNRRLMSKNYWEFILLRRNDVVVRLKNTLSLSVFSEAIIICLIGCNLKYYGQFSIYITVQILCAALSWNSIEFDLCVFFSCFGHFYLVYSSVCLA